MPTIENIQIISDAALFQARNFLVDGNRVPNGTATRDDLRSDLHQTLSAFAGRHKFWMHETKYVLKTLGALPDTNDTETRVYATLRVDPDNRIISGDLFSDIARKKWMFSWVSDTVFTPGARTDTLLGDGAEWAEDGWDALCVGKLFPAPDLTFSRRRTQTLGASTFVALAVKCDRTSRTITGCRLIVSDGSGDITTDLMLTDRRQRPRRASFRFFRPIHLISDAVSSDLREVTEDAIGPSGRNIQDILDRKQTHVHWDDNGNAELKTVKDANDFKILTQFQWDDDPYAFAVLFTNTHPNKGNIFGRVLGLDDKIPVNKPRFGAVVYVEAIRRDYEDQCRIEMRKQDPRELAELIQHTYIHELGHLFNIPHSWQQGQFKEPSLPGDPAGISWMNYGSRFPLGNFMKTSRFQDPEVRAAPDRIGEESMLSKRDSWRLRTSTLREPGFTDAEKRWIWHAPLDHVSPGGPYFTQQSRAPLRIEAVTRNVTGETYENPLKLEISGHDPDEDGIIHLANKCGDFFTREAILGQVTFAVSDKFNDKNTIHFVFQSPMLSLMVQVVNPKGGETDWDDHNTTLEIPVTPLPSDWKVRTRKEKREADFENANINGHLHSLATNALPGAEVRPGDGIDRVFHRPLPFIHARFFDQFPKPHFTKAPTQFVLQAALRLQNAEEIRSNAIKIRFGSKFVRYSANEQNVLNHPDLPLLMELLATYPNKMIDDLYKPDPHLGTQRENPLGDLLDKIERVEPGPVSAVFFEYLGGIVKAARSDDVLKTFDDLQEQFHPFVPYYLRDNEELLQKFLKRYLTERPNA